ncbi:hypothetical protein NSQ91_14265 [Paenibacillus sp. FSL R7-0048]|uniref:hypothetical protein n=1 Tax=Paenibacillus TaxID=44249 RepID=UPI00096EAB8A|nr:hypothetical protein [Paenibacillus odorifer]OMD87846.1 hypothetical protein BSK53_02335 [Paenibacillus odorifer]
MTNIIPFDNSSEKPKKKQSKYIKKVINGQELTWSIEFQAWGVFRPYRKNQKTGELEWAKMYGKRAFFIPVYYGPLMDDVD